MKILYAVQATGNGHISRAMEILPYLQCYGNVDIFLSGANSSLALQAPVKFRSKGVSLFYTCHGKLDYLKIFSSFAPGRLSKEVKELPVENYDLVLNDFECITALACRYKKIPSVNFGHQASFNSSKTPRPKNKSLLGEWILKNYAAASFYVGLHFQQYDYFILPPVIKKEINEATPTDDKFIAVYLPSYCEHIMQKFFHSFPDYSFRIFSFETKEIKENKNITFLPVGKALFNDALIHCTGIITGAGFETPAEALRLGKKLMIIPIKGQYEQQCNAAALEKMGINNTNGLNDEFKNQFYRWIQSEKPSPADYSHSTEDIINRMMKLSMAYLAETKDFSQSGISPDNSFPFSIL